MSLRIQRPLMKNRLLTLIVVCIFSMGLVQPANACFSYFTYQRACAGDTVWFHPVDPSAVYCWTFGDSLSSANISFDQNPYHVYDTPGIYYVTLFTNIGAEWDYYTTTIVVSTNCFEADYTWNCNGSLQIAFNDYSVGAPVSWLWYFDDPASGTSDTSVLSSPNHTFSVAGTYYVQLIISDGVQSDTIQQTVNVNTVCLEAIFGQTIILPCWGDTFSPYVNYSGAITNYSWDFGDPGSGLDNFSNLQHPGHIYWSPGIYTIRLIVSDTMISDTNYLYVEVVDCRIWPGDVNKDGDVNLDDLFGIGIYFGQTGTTRPGATTTFTPQECTDWLGFQNGMYLQDYLNAKHADCNGDGVINLQDFNVILNNYGLRSDTSNNLSMMQEVAPTAPELGFATDSIDAYSGATVQMPVYLGIEDSAKNIYGFSFRVNYDPYFFGYVSADFYSSWIDDQNPSAIMNYTNNSMEGWIDVAAVRTSTGVLSGKGEIVVLYFHPGFVDWGQTLISIAPTAKVISNGLHSYQNNQMVVQPVELRNLTIDMFSSIEENANTFGRVYPNPATDLLNIEWRTGTLFSIEIYNLLGQSMTNAAVIANKKSIDVSAFPIGAYFIKAETDQGTFRLEFTKH